jgi:DNA (cytosine-5)-methyltransferase 1
MNLKVASLFSGCGGMDLGIQGDFKFLEKFYAKQPIDLVFASDIDSYAVKIYNENFEHKAVQGDIRDLKNYIPAHDILIGGFPCQSFSIVAQNPPRLGYKNDTGKLFFEMVDVLKKHSPRAFIAENVKGLLSANKKQAFPLILDAFRDAGYYCKHVLLNSVELGVPQKRERVFIVGFKNEQDMLEFKFPEPLRFDERSVLSDVLIPEAEIPQKYFFSERAVEGMLKAKDKMNKGRAQNPMQACNTISSHLSKASLNSVDPVMCLNGRYRRFTPLEASRIQSFPEFFTFTTSDTRAFKAIGNAVPPVMMWHVANQLIDVLSPTCERDFKAISLKTC